MAKKSPTKITWQEYNRHELFNALAEIKHAVVNHLQTSNKKKVTRKLTLSKLEVTQDMPLSALDELCQNLRLNNFERKVLLFCVACELINDFPALCAELHGNSQLSYPTLGLLLTVFPEEAYWEVLAPQSSLRYWMLIEMDVGTTKASQRLQVSEYILHYLLGNFSIDNRLTTFLKPLTKPLSVTPSHQATIEKMWALLTQSNQQKQPPCLHLSVANINEGCRLVASASQQWNLPIYHLSIQLLSSNVQDLDLLVRLLEREALLNRYIFLIEYDTTIAEKKSLCFILTKLIEQITSSCILISETQPRWLDYPITNLEIPSIIQQEQLHIWQAILKDNIQLDPDWLQKLSMQFKLHTSQIQSIATAVNLQTDLNKDELSQFIWKQCRQQVRQQVSELVQVIEPKVTWHDLVLPDLQTRLLHDIAVHVAQRYKVYQQWGFAEKSSRGLGICALFAGPSGTGKTLAAEVLAHELGLDLYHIDLSMMVSKYIGETEKHIKKIFELAEASGAILFFDEADALFGKRSEVKDSHDRYANIEVSYLLQRIEAYQGLSILTTNLKSAIDEAFLRRIRFIVQFPFPDTAQRKLIWQRIFPDQTPTHNLDFEKLARLNLNGGHIRNIALNSAFLAADENAAVSMQHILQAAHSEYLKLEKTLLEHEVKDWN